ncbi:MULTISPECIES: ABC transporter permease [Lacrimispora]|jgi:peptide/nickel transport system permease protein|uniref:ABC transporter permease n=1 Tax=Lacrimispora TaxID=2719231 RepID=UPI000BE48B4F|nr:ABC transporter permease [Lacrimispora amygdalina]MDK2968056.1 peptide/nickel transport system permease protein [Lacrimispora sp.]
MPKTTYAKKQSGFATVMKQMSKNKAAMLGLLILSTEIILAILAPYIIPYDYSYMDMANMFAKPSASHLFGCDDMGRDIFSRVLYGARYSISIGIIAVSIGSAIGCTIGAISGFFGGQVDNIIMRLLDIIQAIPGMLLMIVISAVLGPGYFNTIIALSIGSISGMARMLRAQMLKERENEYIEAAQSINCSKFRIITSHLLPNCISPMIVSATMGVAQTITIAAGLSFIGLGVQPPIPEWGAMLSAARQFIRQAPHLVYFPGLAIAVTVLALNLLGDGLRDALDPKLKN